MPKTLVYQGFPHFQQVFPQVFLTKKEPFFCLLLTFVIELFARFLPVFYQIKTFLRPEKDKFLTFLGTRLYIKPKRANTVRPYGFVLT